MTEQQPPRPNPFPPRPEGVIPFNRTEALIAAGRRFAAAVRGAAETLAAHQSLGVPAEATVASLRLHIEAALNGPEGVQAYTTLELEAQRAQARRGKLDYERRRQERKRREAGVPPGRKNELRAPEPRSPATSHQSSPTYDLYDEATLRAAEIAQAYRERGTEPPTPAAPEPVTDDSLDDLFGPGPKAQLDE